jgi:glycosyltransferase involved in cell wall biosynthesis
LTLAGPAVGAAETRIIRTAVARNPDRVSYLGAVYGADRDRFFRSLDVLLFPSTYSHESFGLAAWECMLLGTPIIARRAGCLTQTATGPGGVVIAGDANFAEAAVDQLREWTHTPARLAEMRAAAQERATAAILDGTRAMGHLVAELVTVGQDRDRRLVG